MATEPERPIEKLLRACAKKRRDELPEPRGLELHPATRRLLQGEVARRFARGGAQSVSGLRRLLLFRMRLVEALVIIALMAVIGFIMFPALSRSRHNATLAMNRQQVPVQSLTEALQEPASPPARSPAEAVNGFGGSPATPADTALFQSDKAGSLKDREAEVGKDRTLVAGGKMAPGTTITLNMVPSSEAMNGEASRVTSDGRNRAVPPTPFESPLLPSNSGVGGGFAARGDIPAATPASAAAPAQDTTLALAQKKPSGELFMPSGGTAGQLGLAYKSLDKDALEAAPALSMDKKEALGAILADESKANSELAALSRAQPQIVSGEAPGASNDTGLVQRFSRVEATWGDQSSPLNKPLQPVLASFQVEQAGQELRVVDSDGSVYSGTLQTAGELSRRRLARPESLAAARASGAATVSSQSTVTADALRPAELAYFFRVAGTNRSLKQKVVFTGNLIGLTNAAAFARLKGAISNESDGFQFAPAKQGFAPLLNARISGKAVVGNGKAIEINALPTPGPAK